jgi:drug/metabolite transporter (DMT)-like permease
MALAGACSAAFVMVLIRKLSQTDKPTTILLYQALGVGVLIAPLGMWHWVTPSLEEILLLMAIGVVSALAQMSNIHAYRAGEASVMAGLDYIRLLFAVTLGFALFGNWPDIYVFAGAGLIIAAALYTIHRETRLGRKLARSQESRAVAP